MNKKEFLSDLERRLSILDEKEVRDIINEYEGIIDEKIKDGKSEADAVNEFGELDELSSEILKAYKINPKYCSGNTTGRDKAKEVVRSFEEWVKYISGEMAKFLKTASDGLGKSGRTPSVELVLEIVIKIAILLVILAILKIPFYLIGGLWIGIFSFSFTTVDWIFSALWKILSMAVYLAAAICIFWAMFQEYFTGFSSTGGSADAKTNGAKPKTGGAREEKVAGAEEFTKKEPQKRGKSGGVTGVLLTVARVFVVIAVLLPLWLAQAGLTVAILIAVYFFMDGINTPGLIIILAGIMTLVAGLTDLIYKLAYKIRKVSVLCIIPFIISIVLVTTGAFVLANNVLHFEYVDALPKNIKYTVIEKAFTLEDEKRISATGFANVEYEIDEDLANGEVVVMMSYFDEIGKINNIKMSDVGKYYYLTYRLNRRLYDLSVLYDLIINDLKNGKAYNYSKLIKTSVVLKANAATMKTIKGNAE